LSEVKSRSTGRTR